MAAIRSGPDPSKSPDTLIIPKSDRKRRLLGESAGGVSNNDTHYSNENVSAKGSQVLRKSWAAVPHISRDERDAAAPNPTAEANKFTKAEDWRSIVDQSSGLLYYYHRPTRAVSWQLPAGIDPLHVRAKLPPQGQSRGAQSAPSRALSDTGSVRLRHEEHHGGARVKSSQGEERLPRSFDGEGSRGRLSHCGQASPRSQIPGTEPGDGVDAEGFGDLSSGGGGYASAGTPSRGLGDSWHDDAAAASGDHTTLGYAEMVAAAAAAATGSPASFRTAPSENRSESGRARAAEPWGPSSAADLWDPSPQPVHEPVHQPASAVAQSGVRSPEPARTDGGAFGGDSGESAGLLLVASDTALGATPDAPAPAYDRHAGEGAATAADVGVDSGIPRVPCPDCGRHFAQDRLAVHVRACR